METRTLLAILTSTLLCALATAQDSPQSPGLPLLSTLPEAAPDPVHKQALPDLSAWTVTGRDELSTALQFTRYVTNTLTGEVTPEPHGVIFVENGINYRGDDGAWYPALDRISIMGDGSGAAVHGVTKLYCGATLAGGILLVTKSGQPLMSRPSGVYYHDPATGTDVPLAEAQGSAKAEQAGVNRLLYKGAYASEFLEADLLITYCKSGVECDVVITRHPLLTPEDCGLSAETSLQVRSEWINAPLPEIGPRVVERTVAGDLVDQQLAFPDVSFTTGKAFPWEKAVGADPEAPVQIDIGGYTGGEGEVPVVKEWLPGDPSVLIESVRWSAIAPKLARLPLMARAGGAEATQEARAGTQKQGKGLIATASFSKPIEGVVIDWTVVNSATTNFTFCSYTNANTYLITNSASFSATLTFQSNCVVKIAPGKYLMYTGTNLVCNGTTNLPSIITSRDDAAFGETAGLPGYTGCPPQWADTGFWLYSQGTRYSVAGMRIRYATNAIRFDSERGCGAAAQVVSNCVVEFAQTGLYYGNCVVNITNSVTRDVTTAASTGAGCYIVGSFTPQTTLTTHIIAQMKALTNSHTVGNVYMYQQATSYVYTNYDPNCWTYGLKGYSSISCSNSYGSGYYSRQGAGTLITPRHAITISTNHGGAGQGPNYTGQTFRFIGTNGTHYTALCTNHATVPNYDVGVLMFSTALPSDVECARVFPTNGYRKLSSALEESADHNQCSARRVPCIQLGQFKTAYASDWYYLDTRWPWPRRIEPSVWFPAWNNGWLPWDGDSGHPNFLVISNEIVFSGPIGDRIDYSMIGVTSRGTPTNAFNRWLGMKFTVGISDVTIGHLGRWSQNGITATHLMKIVDTSGNMQNCYVQITGGAANAFSYGTFTNGVPTRLSANTTYYLLSQEFAGGDQWCDAAGTQVSSGPEWATCNGWVYSDTGTNNFITSSGSLSFGPLDMKLRWGAQGPLSSGFIPALNGVIGPDRVTEMDLSSFPDL